MHSTNLVGNLFLDGDGEMGRLIDAIDWTTTPLGAAEHWPAAIKTTVALIISSPMPIITLWGEAGTMIYNAAYSELIGDRHPELLGSSARTAWPALAAYNDKVLTGATGRALSYRDQEFTVQRAGRPQRVLFNLDCSPIRDEHGRPIGVFTIVAETTALRDAESDFRRQVAHEVEERSAALIESQEQFRLLVQGVTDYAIYMLDADGRVSSWNAGAERIKGFKPDEIIGSNFSRFYTEEDRAAGAPQHALSVAAREGRFEKEGWRLRKDGTRFWAHVVIDAIHHADGHLLGFAKITRDITERRQTQLALEEAQEQLAQSQKMEAVGSLTGGVAHDFNNLLTAVLGSLELLRKRMPPDPALMRLVDNAIHGAERGSSLTKRMLAFARRQELKSEKTDVRQLVSGMTEMLQRSLGPMLAVETHFPLRLAAVDVDPGQLESAILNLAVNARDAMQGEGRITISAFEQEVPPGARLQPGHYVCLSVTDTGEGMDEETLRKAVEPFFTTKGVGKGTGLGLPMVHGFAQQSRGALVLKSKLGQGTTAEIWVPAFIEPEHAEVPVEPMARQEPPPPIGNLRILAVDDDALVLMNTVAMLEDLGHAVAPAYSADEALQLADSQTFDLVITDHAMPRMTGMQLISELRNRNMNFPVVLATGYAELPDGDGNDLPRLSKPFSQRELETAVREALN